MVLLHRILAFKDLGFTLEQIKQLLREEVSIAEMRGMFRFKRAEVQTLIRSEMECLQRIEARLDQIERGQGATLRHEIVVKQVAPLLVVSLRETSNRSDIPGLFEEMDDYLRRNGIVQPHSHIVLWHGCPECESSIHLEIACPIADKLTLGGLARHLRGSRAHRLH